MHQFWKVKNTHPERENDKGETITSRKRIANVFGEFYSKKNAENQLEDPRNLETRVNTERESCYEDVRNEIQVFTQE